MSQHFVLSEDFTREVRKALGIEDYSNEPRGLIDFETGTNPHWSAYNDGAGSMSVAGYLAKLNDWLAPLPPPAMPLLSDAAIQKFLADYTKTFPSPFLPPPPSPETPE